MGPQTFDISIDEVLVNTGVKDEVFQIIITDSFDLKCDPLPAWGDTIGFLIHDF